MTQAALKVVLQSDAQKRPICPHCIAEWEDELHTFTNGTEGKKTSEDTHTCIDGHGRRRFIGDHYPAFFEHITKYRCANELIQGREKRLNSIRVMLKEAAKTP